MPTSINYYMDWKLCSQNSILYRSISSERVDLSVDV